MELFWYDIRKMSEEEYRAAYALLSPARQKRVDGIAAEDDRRRTVAAELLVRKAVGEKLGITPEKVALSVDENDKPHIEGDPLYVSMSHSGAWAVCAIGEKPVGVDVEMIRAAQEKFIGRVCTETEQTYIRYGDAGCYRRFWECWTAKEALFKLTGKGPLLTLSAFALPENAALELILCNGCAVTAATLL